ncbi:aldose epimerase family protein [Flintibacter muris]|uniref:aldose epimerase family protein n=1 Tax=Flintibacter muris TaxID=2941327 RepID=UPI002040C018|nr:aldose epimerase family protein [Flintibacter muris]
MGREFGAPFGVTKNGEEVRELTLNNGVLTAKVITFGGVLRVLTVPGKSGPVDVVLGYDSLAEYEDNGGFFGALIGRYANRIAKGKFTLNGKKYTLALNDGPNHLHGGNVGWSHRVWTVAEAEADRAVLTLDSPDGEEGYPGHLQVKVTYALEGDTLSIRYQASGDQDTPCNLTNHSYFNLSGQGSGTVLDQEIQLYASSYTPADSTSIPLGTVEPVEGTPMDLRALTPIGTHIDEPFQQLEWGHGYDHNFVVDGQPGAMRPAAMARSRATGVVMEVETDSPGLQFYTANFVEEGRRGKEGAVYSFRHGFCLETQHFPDTPNQPAFPSATLRAGAKYDQTTRFRFTRMEG